MSEPATGEWRSYDVRLALLGEELHARARVPTAAVRLADILPVVHSLADALVGVATRLIGAEGKRVSCRAGCAACCRGPIPLAQAEALYLTELMGGMPPARQAAVRERFASGLERLERSGILGELVRRMGSGSPEVGAELASAYFAQQIPCPFLEDERCSIYPHRPAVCREHLVTSPPEHCGAPDEPIERVLLPARVSSVLFRFAGGGAGATARAVPLVAAPLWARQWGEAAACRLPGTQWFESFLGEFSRAELRQEAPPEKRGAT